MNVEHTVAKVDDLKDGQMKEIEVNEHQVLLVRLDGGYRAYVGSCPHHGAPLAEGLLHRGCIRCPWHQAVFDAGSGDLRQPPSLDRLPHYDVRVKGEDVIVTLPDTPGEQRSPAMVTADPQADGRTFAIVGAGAAGLVAAETLRREGFRGRIVLITREGHPAEEKARRSPRPHGPYDRTELSKRYLTKPDATTPYLRDGSFYEDNGIELLAGRRVVEFDAGGKRIVFTDGEALNFDRALLATGGTPRTLGVPGEDLPDVLPLRSLDDCEAIREQAENNQKAVVVGAGFIGMEVCASLTQRGLSVTVVAPEEVPFTKTFGEQIGRMYQGVHEKKGAAFRLGRTVDRFEGDGKLEAVVLDDGERIEADFAVVGVGVRPATDGIAGLETNDDGSVTVDSHLRLSEDVYAAGDIARFPDWRTGGSIRIEHWRLAQQHGQVAAKNMAGGDVEYLGIPFFWTNQHMVIAQHVGFARDWDDLVVDGDIDEQQFVAWYVKDGKVLAAAGCQEDRRMAAAAEVLRESPLPSVEEIRRQVQTLVEAMES